MNWLKKVARWIAAYWRGAAEEIPQAATSIPKLNPYRELQQAIAELCDDSTPSGLDISFDKDGHVHSLAGGPLAHKGCCDASILLENNPHVPEILRAPRPKVIRGKEVLLADRSLRWGGQTARDNSKFPVYMMKLLKEALKTPKGKRHLAFEIAEHRFVKDMDEAGAPVMLAANHVKHDMHLMPCYL